MSSRVLVVALLATFAVLATVNAQGVIPPVLLRPSGSTAPSALLSGWKTAFNTATQEKVNMAYLAQSTVSAKQLFSSNAVDFALVEVPLTSSEKEQAVSSHGSEVAHTPLAATGLAIVFNSGSLGISNLQLNASVLAKIFSGAITRWNDAELVSLNAALANVNHAIRPVLLNGKFGTNFILTRYLNMKGSANSASYTIAYSGDNADWETSSADAADEIASTAYAIGYLPYGDAVAHSLATASILNEDGQYVKPSITSFAAAATAANQDLPSGKSLWADNLLMARPSATGNAYPISFYVYAIYNLDQGTAGANGAATGAFLYYLQTPEAQTINAQYGYAALNQAAIAVNNATFADFVFASGYPYTNYWPAVAPSTPPTAQPPPTTPPASTLVKSSAIQIVIIIALVILILLLIAYDQYRGGCIIKCNSTGRGIWA